MRWGGGGPDNADILWIYCGYIVDRLWIYSHLLLWIYYGSSTMDVHCAATVHEGAVPRALGNQPTNQVQLT